MRGATTPAAAAGADLRPGAAARRRPRRADGLAARLDRLERRVARAGAAPPRRPLPRRRARSAAERRAVAPAPTSRRARARRDAAPVEPRSAEPRPPSRPAAPEPPAPERRSSGRRPPAAEPPRRAEPARRRSALADVRRIWPDLLEQVKKMRRFTWILLSQNAQVIGVDATSLTVGFKNAGARDSFLGGGSEEILRQAAIDMIGADWKVETRSSTRRPSPAQETRAAGDQARGRASARRRRAGRPTAAPSAPSRPRGRPSERRPQASRTPAAAPADRPRPADRRRRRRPTATTRRRRRRPRRRRAAAARARRDRDRRHPARLTDDQEHR